MPILKTVTFGNIIGFLGNIRSSWLAPTVINIAEGAMFTREHNEDQKVRFWQDPLQIFVCIH